LARRPQFSAAWLGVSRWQTAERAQPEVLQERRRGDEKARPAAATEAGVLGTRPRDTLDISLVAIAQDFSEAYADDHEQLAAELPVYDAPYAWCRLQANGGG